MVTGTNNLDVPLWVTIVFWVVTAVMFIFTLMIIPLISGRGTMALLKFFKGSVMFTIIKILAHISLFYFPALLIWFYVMFITNKSKTLFNVT